MLLTRESSSYDTTDTSHCKYVDDQNTSTHFISLYHEYWKYSDHHCKIMTSSTAIAEAESRWWLMPGRQIEAGLMQCGINMWPTVSVCGRLWVQMQTPRGTLKCQSIAPQSKEPTSVEQCECWAVPLHTDTHAPLTTLIYPKEQKQKVILRLFRIFPFF